MTALVSAMAVMNTVPDSFAGERDRKTLETLLTSRLSDRSFLLGKLAAATVLGVAAGILLLVVGLIVVNVKPHSGGIVLYSPLDVVAAVGVAALVSMVLANVGVLASLRAPSVMASQRGIVLGLAGGVALVTALVSALPKGWTTDLDRLATEASAESPVLLVAVGAAVLLLLNPETSEGGSNCGLSGLGGAVGG
jgi:ABC-2 type transport system permease protein